MYKAAVIGCGAIGSLYAEDPLIKGVYTHAGAYVASPKTELVAVCDIDHHKASMAAQKWNVPAVYSDIKQLLESEKPDMVSVCTPDHTHAEVLERVLTSKGVRAVIAEKPLALTVSEAIFLVELAKKHNVILSVNYSRRFSKAHQAVKHWMDAGKIGKIQSVLGYYTKGIFHNGTHWLDLVRWWIGEVQSFQAIHIKKENKGDPEIDAWFHFPNGATGFLQNIDANIASIFEMDIIGSLGRIRVIDSGHLIEYFTLSNSRYYSGYQSMIKTHECEGELHNTLLGAINDLVDCLEYGKEPLSRGEESVAVLKIASSLAASAEKDPFKKEYA
jgi:predicted dehydrogenase